MRLLSPGAGPDEAPSRGLRDARGATTLADHRGARRPGCALSAKAGPAPGERRCDTPLRERVVEQERSVPRDHSPKPPTSPPGRAHRRASPLIAQGTLAHAQLGSTLVVVFRGQASMRLRAPRARSEASTRGAFTPDQSRGSIKTGAPTSAHSCNRMRSNSSAAPARCGAGRGRIRCDSGIPTD
jgi:hypothetical protein